MFQFIRRSKGVNSGLISAPDRVHLWISESRRLFPSALEYMVKMVSVRQVKTPFSSYRAGRACLRLYIIIAGENHLDPYMKLEITAR